MIKHIVMWKFREGEEENMKLFLSRLNGLKGQIDVIKGLETHIGIKKDGSYDAVLISEFENEADLNAYKHDERHVKVSELCKSIREARAVIDYEE